MKNNLRKKLYSYTSNGKTQRVWCNYWEFLLLKLCYSDNGLTEQEYKNYKEHNANKNEKTMDKIDYLFCYVFDYSTDTIHKLMIQESAKTPKDFGSSEELLDYWGFNPDECAWMFSDKDIDIAINYEPRK